MWPVSAGGGGGKSGLSGGPAGGAALPHRATDPTAAQDVPATVLHRHRQDYTRSKPMLFLLSIKLMWKKSHTSTTNIPGSSVGYSFFLVLISLCLSCCCLPFTPHQFLSSSCILVFILIFFSLFALLHSHFPLPSVSPIKPLSFSGLPQPILLLCLPPDQASCLHCCGSAGDRLRWGAEPHVQRQVGHQRPHESA